MNIASQTVLQITFNESCFAYAEYIQRLAYCIQCVSSLPSGQFFVRRFKAHSAFSCEFFVEFSHRFMAKRKKIKLLKENPITAL